MNLKIKKFLKHVLDRKTITRLKDLLYWFDCKLIHFASRTTILTRLYYLFWSSEFTREMYAVINARRRYLFGRVGSSPSSFTLRRNIHRLEKGLVMKPRREVFGEGYIAETVDYFKYCLAEDALLSSERIWATSVLQEYFHLFPYQK